jgi:hypothetical protein
MPQQIPWEQWKAAFVKEWADHSATPCTDADIARDPGWDAWKEYYDRGLTPWQAIEADATE